ncbi:MAG: rhomboid family intramembrane serine protease [Erysipelotrichaceae bacterium]|nr:rhomboid family intramembrane serine protease [Erysipelotrichaceae bacterium]
MQGITFGILFVCIAIFIYINSHQDKMDAAMKAGALYPPKVKKGEYWRLLTSGFIHITPYHLVVNMYSLYNFGWMEEYLGSFRYALILIISIIGGSLLTTYVGKKNALTVGISGGIYGLTAVYILMLLRSPYVQLYDIIHMFMPMIVVNFLPNISVTGHLGGFAAGLLLGLLLRI